MQYCVIMKVSTKCGICIFRYSSVEEYQRINIALLMMESAERSVRAGSSSIHIKHVEIKWKKDISNGKCSLCFKSRYSSLQVS